MGLEAWLRSASLLFTNYNIDTIENSQPPHHSAKQLEFIAQLAVSDLRPLERVEVGLYLLELMVKSPQSIRNFSNPVLLPILDLLKARHNENGFFKLLNAHLAQIQYDQQGVSFCYNMIDVRRYLQFLVQMQQLDQQVNSTDPLITLESSLLVELHNRLLADLSLPTPQDFQCLQELVQASEDHVAMVCELLRSFQFVVRRAKDNEPRVRRRYGDDYVTRSAKTSACVANYFEFMKNISNRISFSTQTICEMVKRFEAYAALLSADDLDFIHFMLGHRCSKEVGAEYAMSLVVTAMLSLGGVAQPYQTAKPEMNQIIIKTMLKLLHSLVVARCSSASLVTVLQRFERTDSELMFRLVDQIDVADFQSWMALLSQLVHHKASPTDMPFARALQKKVGALPTMVWKKVSDGAYLLRLASCGLLHESDCLALGGYKDKLRQYIEYLPQQAREAALDDALKDGTPLNGFVATHRWTDSKEPTKTMLKLRELRREIDRSSGESLSMSISGSLSASMSIHSVSSASSNATSAITDGSSQRTPSHDDDGFELVSPSQ